MFLSRSLGCIVHAQHDTVADLDTAAAAAAWRCMPRQVLFAERAKGKQHDLQLPYVDKERARQREEKALQVGRFESVATAVGGPWLALAVQYRTKAAASQRKLQMQ
jgi:hypothetical protein